MEENILKAISYFSAAFFIITAVTLFLLCIITKMR